MRHNQLTNRFLLFAGLLSTPSFASIPISSQTVPESYAGLVFGPAYCAAHETARAIRDDRIEKTDASVEAEQDGGAR